MGAGSQFLYSKSPCLPRGIHEGKFNKRAVDSCCTGVLMGMRRSVMEDVYLSREGMSLGEVEYSSRGNTCYQCLFSFSFSFSFAYQLFFSHLLSLSFRVNTIVQQTSTVCNKATVGFTERKQQWRWLVGAHELIA